MPVAMLSRVADSLYWMSRYMERSENIARILDVNLQHMLDLPKNEQESDDMWKPVLSSSGDDEAFYETHTKATTETILEFLVLSRDNPSSIWNCIQGARDNARHIREVISDEMWEELNRFFLELRGVTMHDVFRRSPHEFLKHIRNGNHLFQGITNSTMLHSEGWDFIQVGRFIERADKTTRILDANEDALILDSADPALLQARQALKLSAILNSCSGHAGYRRSYVAEVEPQKVLEFLILNEEFPRSIRFCVHELDEALHRISGIEGERFSNEAEKLTGRLLSEFNFSTIEDVLEAGLHETMDEIQVKLNRIGAAIQRCYMVYGLAAEEEERKNGNAASDGDSQSQSQSQRSAGQSQSQT